MEALLEEATRLQKQARHERQVRFLMAVARGGSQKEAAHALGVSEQHIKNTLSDLYARLDVGGFPGAVYVLWLKDLWGE